MPSREAANTNYIIFGLIWPELEPSIYCTWCVVLTITPLMQLSWSQRNPLFQFKSAEYYSYQGKISKTKHIFTLRYIPIKNSFLKWNLLFIFMSVKKLPGKISSIMNKKNVYLLLIHWGERWLFVLLIFVELLIVTV